MNLKPPTCTCRGDGGRVVISFTADKSTGLGGAVRIDTGTPVLKAIPSYVQTPDLPLCAKGQTSTKANPCA